MRSWNELGRRRRGQRAASSAALGQLAADLRLALRSLARRPGFAVAASLTLALGIGANVAMFSVANLALFRALPYPDSDRLVLGRTSWPGGGIGWTVSAPDYYDVRDQARSFQSLAAITPFTRDVTITGSGEPQRVSVAWVSPGFFRTLGVAPRLGREFLPEEGEPGAAAVAILSHELWRTRLGGDRDAVGSALIVDGAPVSVVGVLPADFEFIADAELWIPMVQGEAFASARQFHNWLLVGRLQGDVSIRDARAEVDLIMSRLAEAYPESNRDKGMLLTDMQEAVVESFRPTLLMLMGAVMLVLLIACGNVASLLLVRGSVRRTELAVRSALGANEGRLMRLLLTESAVLALAAGLAGTLAALWLRRALVTATPLTRLGLEAAGIQPEVLLFALTLSLATVAVFGVAPALTAARIDLAEDLKSGSRSVATGRTRFRNGLVVVQVALSVVLLVGAGLLLRSFAELRHVDPGFDSARLLTAEIGLPRVEYDARERRVQFYSHLLDRVRAIPGVRSASMISHLPMRDQGGNVAVWDPANPPADAADWQLAYARVILPRYFETMGIPLRAGRDFQTTDDQDAPPAMVISETMARTLFPDQTPVGSQVAVDQGGEPGYYEVVGVVGDVQVSDLTSDVDMVMYFPYAQRPAFSMRMAVRAAAATGPLVGPLRAALRELDPDIPLADLADMEEILSRSVSFRRSVMRALGLSAGIALFLAALGLYGVLAYYVGQRSHEIGVRVALGARARDVLGMVLGRGFALVGLGLVIGLAASIAAARLIEGLLFRVGATDPATYVGVSLFFALVALVSCLIPAWRAWRVDPVVAFRSE